MKISDVKAHHIRIPYDAGVASFRQGASSIAALEIVMVEVTTDTGLTGWGDAFSYVCPRTTLAAINEMIAPQARGQEVPDAAGIPAFMEQIQRNLHLFGRYGITMFAISGARHRAVGSRRAREGRAVAPAARRAEARTNSGLCQPAADRRARPGRRRMQQARGQGYSAIKLHETTIARGAGGAEGDRCGHSADGRHELPDGRRDRDCLCPCLPRGRRRCSWKSRCGRRRILRRSPKCASKGGLDVAAGENACTAHQFRQMMEAGAVSHAQPSVTKVGGITEYLKVVALADELGVRLTPHSPYFGPGLLATLQLLSLRDDATLRRNLLHEARRHACGAAASTSMPMAMSRCPRGPGIGYEPDRRRDGAIPRVVTAERATSRLPSPAQHPLRQAASLPRALPSSPSSSRLALRRLQFADDLLQADDRAFSASICRLAASNFC